MTLSGRFFFLSEVIFNLCRKFLVYKEPTHYRAELYTADAKLKHCPWIFWFFFWLIHCSRKLETVIPYFMKEKKLLNIANFTACTRPGDPLRMVMFGSSSFPSRIKNAGAVLQSTMCVVERELLIVCAIFQAKRVLNIICTLRSLTVNILHSITWGYSSIGAGKPILTQIPS